MVSGAPETLESMEASSHVLPALTPSIPLKRRQLLLCPRQRGTVAQIENRHGKHLASVDQPLQHLGRKIGLIA